MTSTYGDVHIGTEVAPIAEPTLIAQTLELS